MAAGERTMDDGVSSSKGTVFKMVNSHTQGAGSVLMSAQMSDAGTIMMHRGNTVGMNTSQAESDVFLKGTPSLVGTLTQSQMGEIEDN